jgi:hypothetical protein
MKPYPENAPVYGSESNLWEGNQLYGPVFAGTPASSGEVPRAVVHLAELMTKQAAEYAGPDWR